MIDLVGGLGMATAAVVMAVLFLKHLRSERRCQAEERKQYLDAMTNHIAHNTEVLADLCAAVKGLVAKR